MAAICVDSLILIENGAVYYFNTLSIYLFSRKRIDHIKISVSVSRTRADWPPSCLLICNPWNPSSGPLTNETTLWIRRQFYNSRGPGNFYWRLPETEEKTSPPWTSCPGLPPEFRRLFSLQLSLKVWLSWAVHVPCGVCRSELLLQMPKSRQTRREFIHTRSSPCPNPSPTSWLLRVRCHSSSTSASLGGFEPGAGPEPEPESLRWFSILLSSIWKVLSQESCYSKPEPEPIKLFSSLTNTSLKVTIISSLFIRAD
jgi:hypothetical protein